jgi:predicted amidophosphoribosyltransferase
LLARRLSAATGIPLHTKLLRRTAATLTQTRLSRDERADNVHRAFAAAPGVALHGERVVLVDDVLTTGATTNACARALKRAGASEVCVWTVARGL